MWTIDFIFVRERTNPIHWLVVKRKDDPYIVVLVIFSAHIENQAVPGWNYEAGGPNFDLQIHGLAWGQQLLFIMDVPRPVGL
jgi:hypothetical protein